MANPDHKQLRQLARKLAADYYANPNAPNPFPSRTQSVDDVTRFKAEVNRRLTDGPIGVDGERILEWLWERHRPDRVPPLTPQQIAQRLQWAAEGPNAFYWGPWLP